MQESAFTGVYIYTTFPSHCRTLASPYLSSQPSVDGHSWPAMFLDVCTLRADDFILLTAYTSPLSLASTASSNSRSSSLPAVSACLPHLPLQSQLQHRGLHYTGSPASPPTHIKFRVFIRYMRTV